MNAEELNKVIATALQQQIAAMPVTVAQNRSKLFSVSEHAAHIFATADAPKRYTPPVQPDIINKVPEAENITKYKKTKYTPEIKRLKREADLTNSVYYYQRVRRRHKSNTETTILDCAHYMGNEYVLQHKKYWAINHVNDAISRSLMVNIYCNHHKIKKTDFFKYINFFAAKYIDGDVYNNNISNIKISKKMQEILSEHNKKINEKFRPTEVRPTEATPTEVRPTQADRPLSVKLPPMRSSNQPASLIKDFINLDHINTIADYRAIKNKQLSDQLKTNKLTLSQKLGQIWHLIMSLFK